MKYNLVVEEDVKTVTLTLIKTEQKFLDGSPRQGQKENVYWLHIVYEDFVLTVGHSYFLDYVMKKIDMKDLDDTPTHKLLPENIKQLHAPSKQKIFDAIMEEVIADIYTPYETQVSLNRILQTLIS
ncbi:Hypothetical predicted protein [Mytilus galloprovincialis]|uniref:Uncharacterized protein n=1 Tax=Mytilus galloprovincialis TaxID=29158 RepID=A0A8B6BRZ5_MYTGA|nr:Hypothetical predicted protein [Mytilus galloprovincialis]